ncbi:MAG TPA: hypothetical protein VIQ31_33885 [Phormidium sp.]
MSRNPAKKVCVFLNQHRPLSVPYVQRSIIVEGQTAEERDRNTLNQPTYWVRFIGGATIELDSDIWEIVKCHPAVEELYLMGLLYEIPMPDMDRLHQLDKTIVGGDIVKGLYEPQPVLPVQHLNTGNSANMWKPPGVRPNAPVNPLGSTQLEHLAIAKASQARFNEMQAAGGNAAASHHLAMPTPEQ